LYFVSTLGSAAGTILTSFYLVLWFELDTIIVSLIAMSFVAGLALLAAGRRGERTR
ncbi:TPA: glycosyl transferase, partial [Xanthomonas vasicola pv. zeae]|nr:glycosyl transferase [Xanthomonas vasicola pv. zeae]